MSMNNINSLQYTVESGYNENSVKTNKFSNYGWFVCLIHGKNFGWI